VLCQSKPGLSQSEYLLVCCKSLWEWWLGTELNRRHKDFQSSALPTELPSQPN
jgi:hypothetical protein